MVDWEVEVVVVIGSTVRHVAVDEAWDVVAGLTVGQDISDRQVQLTGTPPQFSLGKSFPGYAPIGPAVVSVDGLSPIPMTSAPVVRRSGERDAGRPTSHLIFVDPARWSPTCPRSAPWSPATSSSPGTP